MGDRAVWIDAPGQLRVRPARPAAPAAGEVLVRVAWAGLCGSDREIMRGTRPAGYVRYPVLPGHEWSGTVETVGPGVAPSLVGQPVVAEGVWSCRICAACRRGDTNLCAGPYDETGFTRPGAWSDHLIVPATLLHPLPAGIDLRAAAVLEPAACAAAACLLAGAVPGMRIAVVGAGTLGLLATQLLAAGGPAELVAVDPRTHRADLAVDCGATTLISPDEAATGTRWRRRFDVVVEAAGAPGSAHLATALARRGAHVVLTGLASTEDHPLVPVDLVVGGITLHTVFGAPSRAWTHAVRAFTAGLLRPEPLITHEVALDDAARALALLDTPSSDITKILLRV
ncbi:alcohol dehydrogenase catalytic domain-containing protein [Frankia sp. Ag45/Mut15]|uniref:Alcohol dehydrogenase catalytic domain-containing protein n=1 Tax=Frankia umida TaxID=573489 RepID=A0ABT0K353_9ACTN|nr:alcohol dehydrogenase catalytic domain-containing protein [Frankia umida]MCK9878151.1 alcohol dehydrogenase catalytic domain-containing protein [Frankia umida]